MCPASTQGNKRRDVSAGKHLQAHRRRHEDRRQMRERRGRIRGELQRMVWYSCDRNLNIQGCDPGVEDLPGRRALQIVVVAALQSTVERWTGRKAAKELEIDVGVGRQTCLRR